MDINFKFSNLVGSVYRNGNVVFSPDGFTVYSPVGNKVSVFDLRNNLSRTLCIDSHHNIIALEISPSGAHLIAANEAGFVFYVNLSTEMTIFTFRNGSKLKAMRFSPDSKNVAVCRDNDLQIFEISAFTENAYYPFHIRSTYHVAADTVTTLDWSHDGKLVVCGSEDKGIRLVSSKKLKNFYIQSLGSHKGPVIAVQFLEKSYDLISVDARGFCIHWSCSLTADDLIEGDYVKKPEGGEEDPIPRIFFEKTNTFSVIESAGTGKLAISVTAARFHTKSNILVTAFSNGVFVLHEIPSFSLIHNLRVSEMEVQTTVFNNTGDWIALGCGKGTAAQLIVWEWQSETYVMKQQSHSQRVTSCQFSPDGALLATGAEDGKVKVWNSRNSFCTVTFDEHTSSVTAVCWTQNGKAILSASLDGTVRAHDMKRYRNFRTLVCPEPTQLGSLAVDSRGDIVCAAGKEVYNIFIWSMENGRLLDILAGHQSNISAISLHGNKLASASWDRTVRVWNIVDSSAETQELAQEALCVAFSPCGLLLATLTLDSAVSLYRADDLTPVGTIEAKLDLDAGRLQNEQIMREKSQLSKSFTTMAFSPDSALLILGGESNFVCLYSVADRILLRKFKITENQSFDGVVLDINRRNFTEFGNMKLFDDSDSEEDVSHRRAIQLPGSKHTDLGERRAKPEMAVYNVGFCPTGRRFGVCSSEGVGLYSLDTVGMFDPFQLDSQTSPTLVKNLISLGDFAPALMGALRLNDSSLIQKALEATPVESISLVSSSLPVPYAEKLLKWMVDDPVVWNSPHVHFYMVWIRSILHIHGMKLKGRTDVSILTGLQQIVAHHSQLISKTADQNRFSLKYLSQIARKGSEQKIETE